MATGLEIFGAVAAALSIIGKTTVWFGTRRNTPRQVQRLQQLLEEDLSDTQLISKARPKDLAKLTRLIDECTTLLERQRPDRASNRIWNFFFSAEAEAALKGYNDEIEFRLIRLCQNVHGFANEGQGFMSRMMTTRR